MILSKLRPLLGQKSLALWRPMSDHRVLPIQPSRWQWTKFKDLFHFYIMLGVIPLGLITAYANVFIGPATLSEIPEGYTPKYWEYYKSPITRFFARYVMTSPQQDYEKYLAYLFMENEKRQLRMLETQVKQKIAERRDYQAYYYRPVMAKYHRLQREVSDYLETIRGE
ncbi:NADH dehydrogenase [ubiquinone] 1 beta subcomplex subunit 5, mitochondrial [Tribolium castaneum]|uniref:NADH dehydrogenase [ubiquinone] 1 beta subcomplex subunit 5, mitochondrial n=1 Tax=Tribolium castaneum TaxID=7070 RepID=D6X546_TRICA|nr:PREDICTED: NADH dehydrogenase [ubiquinone] 1 beta subcomplex subunit 5, mitochondrial [Tribolium castaneum]EEZ97690.1 lethal neo18 [Tribolium castaneum]|eukprot:XP_971885.1 PREDICTED: NADH dehydrogenase [ubiquinone] 1 beta subcomplex subunit 5, mitochondrial [Tribolium castaneum]